MTNAKLWITASILCLLMVAALPATAAVAVASSNTMPGAACANGNCCSGTFTFDTGADETLLSQACGNDTGLLDDADGDGTPDASNGEITVNGNLKAWCFPGVAVAAVGTDGETCTSTETVYIIQDSTAHLAGSNLLGLPWQQSVEACYIAKTQDYIWPCDLEAKPTETTPVRAMADLKSAGRERGILEGVYVAGIWGGTTLNMTFSAGLPYTFIPASVAAGLGEIEGTIDLSIEAPEVLVRLNQVAMNPTGQTVFGVLTLDSFHLGAGPSGYPVQVLVSHDANSDFGIMGDNLLQTCDATSQWIYDFRIGDRGGLVYASLDCNLNGLSDSLEMNLDPTTDADGDHILDACQKATGAACLRGGGCQVVSPELSTIIGASYRGNGVSCASAGCGVRLQANPPGGAPTTPAGPTLF